MPQADPRDTHGPMRLPTYTEVTHTMCENGINTDQLKVSIGQVADSLGMSQQWLEQLHHMADHAKRPEASAELARATVALGEARAKLDAALEVLEGHPPSDVTVELV